MKAGILTFHWAYNYGAVLQTYALQETLIQMGVEATVLDYRPSRLMARIGPLGLRSGRFMHVLPMRWRFDRFRKQHLNLTRRLLTTEDLKEATRDYDAVIVGSDQVWNMNIIKGDLNYFLAFADGVRKVSYAADFGQMQQIQQSKAHVSRLLGQFDHISVRTGLSKEIAGTLSSKNVEVVLDPTLLHDFSDTTVSVEIKEPYILVYSIWGGTDNEVLRSLVKEIASEYKFPVYSVSWSRDFPSADCHLRSLGPVQWLEYFRKAAFVCTDSYHGFIFAIKNRKPFIAVCLNNRASRILEVAQRYGLDSSVVTGTDSTRGTMLTQQTDYAQVDSLLNKDVQASKAFLRDALFCRHPHDKSRPEAENLNTQLWPV